MNRKRFFGEIDKEGSDNSEKDALMIGGKDCSKDNAINTLQSLTLQKDDVEDLSLSLCDSDSIPPGYNQIPMTQLSKQEVANAFSTAVGLVTQASTMSCIANGLYQSKVSAAQLIKYANGDYSSMIRGNNGQIQEHAGFSKAGADVFSPMILFQLTSIVTGQYYMHGISKQLKALQESINELQKSVNEMQESINELKEDLERKNHATLKTAYTAFRRYISSSVNTIDELTEIQRYMNSISEICDYYLMKIDDSNNKQLEPKEVEVDENGQEQELVKAINEMPFMKGLKVLKVVGAIFIGTPPNISKSEEQEYYEKICFDAYRLYIISKLVYLKALVSISTNNKEYIPKISDFVKGLEDVEDNLTKSMNDIYNKRLNQQEDEYHKTRLRKGFLLLNDIVTKLRGKDTDLDIFQREINKSHEDFQTQMNQIDSILKPFYRKNDLLIEVKDGEACLYLLDKPE